MIGGGTGEYGRMERGWGPVLVAVGIGVALIGLLAWSGALSWLGKLPGDLRFGDDNVRVYIPITSALLVSVVLSLVLNAVIWLFHR
jgi:hypothetical protein